jgi:hypothetical protein
MRPHGKTKLGFFPLPTQEAARLRSWLRSDSEFSTLDACVGDGAAFTCLLKNTPARRHGIEIDANRAEQARNLGIDTVQANSIDVRCPAESLSLLYQMSRRKWSSMRHSLRANWRLRNIWPRSYMISTSNRSMRSSGRARFGVFRMRSRQRSKNWSRSRSLRPQLNWKNS